MNRLEKTCRIITGYFVLWILLFAGWSLWKPNTFLWVLPNIKWMLGVIMFGMGMTLSAADFQQVLRRPRDVFSGAAAQYLIMPLLAYVLARGLRLSDNLAVGLILLGCCPGGTASNVITFLAKGDVALSVSMTTVSTLLAPLLTPTLMLLLAGHWMHIDAAALFVSIIEMVLLPIVLGTTANHFFGKKLHRIQPLLPVLSIITILLIVGAVIGKDADRFRNMAPIVLAAVILHNGGGLLLGWTGGSALQLGAPQKRALAIEVGMQNSGLAVALAVAHFSPEAALPAALFSVWHNISGPALATIWNRRDPKNR